MRLALRLAFGFAGVALIHFAQAEMPSAEVFFKDPDITEAVLSPAANRLAIATSLGAERVGRGRRHTHAPHRSRVIGKKP